MGVIGWHYDNIPCRNIERFAVDGYLRRAFDYLHHSIERCSVFAKALPFVEREESDAAVLVLGEFLADDAVLSIVDAGSEVDDSLCFHTYSCLR